HSVPAMHFSARAILDRNRTLWCGYMIEAADRMVYFAGDTAFGDHFARIRGRFGAPRVALLPIGAFRPRWFMSPVHMAPDDAVRAQRILSASTCVGIHFGTFFLADDGEFEPIELLNRALDEAGEPRSHFWTLDCGEGRDVPSIITHEEKMSERQAE